MVALKKKNTNKKQTLSFVVLKTPFSGGVMVAFFFFLVSGSNYQHWERSGKDSIEYQSVKS